MSSFEVSTEDLQGIYGGVGKICPALPQIGLKFGLMKVVGFRVSVVRIDFRIS